MSVKPIFHAVKQLTPEQLKALRMLPLDGKPNKLSLVMGLTGTTQIEVAEGTGFKQPYVSDVQRGRFRDIGVDNARRFADYFGCSIEDLFPAREAISA